MEDALRGNDISPRRIQSDTGTITAAENDKPVTEPEVKKTKSAKRTLLDGSQDNWEELNQPDVMKSTLWQAPPTPTEKSRPRKRRLLQSQYDDDI